MQFIDLKSQYMAYKDEIDQEIHKVLDSSVYIGGKASEVEEELASFVGSRYAMGCSSGTDALVLALMACGIKPNDEVITTPFTFIATAETVAFLGAKPVFVDIDEKTFNIDASKIEEKITKNTKAIIPVSLFGKVSDMDEINAVAKKYNITVIEDAAQSFGALYKNKRSCNISDISCTSFFPAKPLGCYGDGGAVFTNNEEMAENIRIIKNHGQTERYVHSMIGINGRLDAIQAAVISVKLRHYKEEIQKRQEIASIYGENLKGVDVPYIEPHNISVWAQYCIKTKDRDSLTKRLSENNIPFAVYYPIPLHLQKVFDYLGYKKGDFPAAERVSEEILALPFSAFLKEEDQRKIIDAVNG